MFWMHLQRSMERKKRKVKKAAKRRQQILLDSPTHLQRQQPILITHSDYQHQTHPYSKQQTQLTHSASRHKLETRLKSKRKRRRVKKVSQARRRAMHQHKQKKPVMMTCSSAGKTWNARELYSLRKTMCLTFSKRTLELEIWKLQESSSQRRLRSMIAL